MGYKVTRLQGYREFMETARPEKPWSVDASVRSNVERAFWLELFSDSTVIWRLVGMSAFRPK